MIRSPRRCPCCQKALAISCDMWGQFYACEGCGFTAEDDDELDNPGGRYGALFLEQLKSYSLSATERREIA